MKNSFFCKVAMLSLSIMLSVIFTLFIGTSCIAKEMKGMWVATVFNLDYPTKPTTSSEALKKEADEIIGNCSEMGINSIFLQVRPMSDAFYKSSIYPWSSFLTGSQGTAPDNGFDPLAYWISAAHQKGIKIHAWVNPYRATKSNDANDTLYKGLALTNPAKQHPEYLIKYQNEYYYDPAIPEVRQLVIDGVSEIVSNYDVDGIHFDDYFYPGKDFPDSASFSKYPNGYTDIADWRRENVNILIRTLKDKIKSIKSNVEFGISPSGIWANNTTTPLGSATKGMESYTQLYADTRKWAVEGWVDYIAPQVYWNIGSKAADYKTVSLWWADTMKDSTTKLYIGMGDYRTVDAKSGDVWYGTDELQRQLALNESTAKISGEIHYRYKSVMSNSSIISLYRNQYKTAQIVPISTPVATTAQTVTEQTTQSTTLIQSTEATTAAQSSKSASSARLSFSAEYGNIDVVFPNGEKTANLTVDGNGVQVIELDEIYTNMGSYAVTVGSYEINSPTALRTKVAVPKTSDGDKYYVLGLNKENTSEGKIISSFYYPDAGAVEFSTDTKYRIIQIVKISSANVLTLTIGKKDTTLNGENAKLDAPPEIKSGYTFVPVRYIGESLGVKVDWDKPTETAIFSKNGKSASVTIGKEITGYKGVKAYIKNSRTMVPARYIYETFGAYVLWEPDDKIVTVVG